MLAVIFCLRLEDRRRQVISLINIQASTSLHLAKTSLEIENVMNFTPAFLFPSQYM